MTSQASLYGQFNRALDSGHTLQALALAHELPFVNLADALRLCVLLADYDRPLFEKAAAR